MEYIQEIRVLYADTDSYGVVWHGAYTRWFEAARVGIVESFGFDISDLEKEGILFPVVEMNIRYKSSAKMNEKIIIKSKIVDVTSVSIVFEHNVYEKYTGQHRVNAKVIIVAINPITGKLYRKLPDKLYNVFRNSLYIQ